MNTEIREYAIKAGLPEWVANGINRFAWDIGHAYGQNEVDSRA